MPLKHEKPTIRLMAQLIDVKNAVVDLGTALQKTNWLPDDFELEALEDLLAALKILPDGTAAGAHTTLRATKTELQDFEDRHFLTSTESEQAAKDSGVVNKLSRHSDLGKEFRLLKSACDSALAECRRQAGTTPDKEEPPENELRIDTDPDERMRANAREIADFMHGAHAEIDKAVDDGVAEKDIVTRVLVDTQHLSLTTRAVVTLKTKSIWVGQQLSKAWRGRYVLIEKSMDGLKAANGLTKYSLDRVSKIKDEMRDVIHKNIDEMIDDAKAWTRKQRAKTRPSRVEPLPPIPYVDPKVQKEAERQAMRLLKAGKPVPPEIGVNVRKIGTWGKENNIREIGLFSSCGFLQLLSLVKCPITDFEKLANFRYLRDLNLESTQVFDLAPLKALTQLELLTLTNTQVSDISPLKAMTQMKYIFLADTQVSNLSPLKAMTQMQSLALSDTQVADISPLKDMTLMQNLYLSAMHVSDLSPLKAMTQLQELYLTGTQVSDLSPLKAMTQLQELYLTGTQVTDWSPVEHVPKVTGRPK